MENKKEKNFYTIRLITERKIYNQWNSFVFGCYFSVPINEKETKKLLMFNQRKVNKIKRRFYITVLNVK